MASTALAKAPWGLGGVQLGGGGGVAVVAAGLGLGREAMLCTYPAYAPRLAAAGLSPPMSISPDQVGVQV